MHEKIELYLKNIKDKEQAEKRQRKTQFLLDNGLFDREYSENGYSEEYNTYDHENGKYFKKVAVDCSDEDFEEIMKYGKKTVEHNIISIILISIAILIYVVGFFLGINSYSEYIGAAPMFTIWGMTFAIGTVVYALGEIIRLLDIIAKK